jgi:hypothetical protein
VTVTDLDWDYLPILGYAVRNIALSNYTLCEDMSGTLQGIEADRAVQLGILNTSGQLIRNGQPSIVACEAIRIFISTYVQADCMLSDGRSVEVLTFIGSGLPPQKGWYIGKRPAEAANFIAPSGRC